MCWRAYYVKGQSLRCSPGLGNTGRWAVTLYVGEGLRGSNGTCSTLCWISVTPSSTHNQTGSLWCWFPSGWACACSRPLWVSLMTSPVRLGVSPAASSTPMGVFNQRFEALFPRTGALGCVVLSIRKCGAAGSASCCTACPICSIICQVSGSCCVNKSPVRPSCPSSPLVLVWTTVSSLSPWLLHFCVVWFSVSSDYFLFLNCCPSFGCVRRRSVSTYTSILVPSKYIRYF